MPPLPAHRSLSSAVREGWPVSVWHSILLIVCALAIYLSCEWFVNTVEWLGRRLNAGKMVMGTILAAFGTALPESMVALVAVTTGSTPEADLRGRGRTSSRQSDPLRRQTTTAWRTTVRYRELGRSGPSVSEIGYGTWRYEEGR
jgi:hypothetical protein